MKIDFVKLAIDELNNKTLESTKDCFKYLEIDKRFQTEDAESVYQITDSKYTTISVPILDGKVYILVHIDTENDNVVEEVLVEPSSLVYLSASSKDMGLSELQQIAGTKEVSGWSKGDIRGNRTMDFTLLKITASENGAEYIADKLCKLLSVLEDNREGIIRLCEISDNCIIKVVCWNYYKNIEGLNLSKNIIKRMANLNLAFDLESYLIFN